MASDTNLLGKLLKSSFRYLRQLVGSPPGNAPSQPRRPGPTTTASRTRVPGTGVGQSSRPYPGDFRGALTPNYSPKPDGKPDPGEIVWSWVPYEEDYSQGKDRPVLLVGRDGEWLLGLMLTSKDHDNGDRSDEYVDIGTGPWDSRGRPSEVKVDRVVRLYPTDIRREGAVLDKRTFELVARHVDGRRGAA